MKYFVRVIIVLFVAAGVAFGYSYYYRDQKIKEDIVLTTREISSTKRGEKASDDNKKLIKDIKEADYQFYADDEYGYIVHNGIQKKDKGLLFAFTQTTFETYYNDFDGDGEKELLLLYGNPNTEITQSFLPTDKTSFENMFSYAILIEPIIDEDGKDDLWLIVINQSVWKKPFDSAIASQMNQLKSCDKYLQIVMDDNDVELAYNNDTGISSNKYVFYAKALKNNNTPGYQKLNRWSKGNGMFSVDSDGNLHIDIMVFAYYETNGEKAQYVGNIKSEITFTTDASFTLKPKTITFETNKQYACPDPREQTDEKFTYIVNNSGTAVTNTADNQIDWLEGTFNAASSIKAESIDFSDMASQIKCINNISINQSSVTLTAKDGYEFSDTVIKTGDYSVTINTDSDDEYDISYSVELKNKKTLKITFDKKYTQKELGEINIKFGS